jgi:hypothetical protein
MIPTTKLLLKHGVRSLLTENNNFFKQNIIQTLAIKLDKTVKESKNLVERKLFQRDTITENTEELREFLDFINNFKGGVYNFKNGSSINITESEIQSLKQLFESLNPQNRQKMISEIFEDGIKFKEHINFSQKVMKLL